MLFIAIVTLDFMEMICHYTAPDFRGFEFQIAADFQGTWISNRSLRLLDIDDLSLCRIYGEKPKLYKVYWFLLIVKLPTTHDFFPVLDFSRKSWCVLLLCDCLFIYLCDMCALTTKRCSAWYNKLVSKLQKWSWRWWNWRFKEDPTWGFPIGGKGLIVISFEDFFLRLLWL